MTPPLWALGARSVELGPLWRRLLARRLQPGFKAVKRSGGGPLALVRCDKEACSMQFQILGPLRVTDDRRPEVALGGAKPAALLAMLLLRPNELVASDRLIEDLWDGQ